MTGYERRDIRFPEIAKAFGGVALLIAGVALASVLALGAYGRFAPENRRRIPPPEPRLQSDPVEELRRRRAEEVSALARYRWMDRSRGVIRVPIERAMTLLLRRGLPTRASSARNAP